METRKKIFEFVLDEYGTSYEEFKETFLAGGYKKNYGWQEILSLEKDSYLIILGVEENGDISITGYIEKEFGLEESSFFEIVEFEKISTYDKLIGYLQKMLEFFIDEY